MSNLAGSLWAISQYEANKKELPKFNPMIYIIEYERGKLITVQELLDFFMENKDKVERKSKKETELQSEQEVERLSPQDECETGRDRHDNKEETVQGSEPSPQKSKCRRVRKSK